jgi:hypothetical protein
MLPHTCHSKLHLRDNFHPLVGWEPFQLEQWIAETRLAAITEKDYECKVFVDEKPIEMSGDQKREVQPFSIHALSLRRMT